MTHLHSSKNLAPRVLSKRISFAGISAVAAAAALMFSAESAHAGATELKYLTAALTGAGTSTASADSDQIAAAVAKVLQEHPTLKPGVVAGEALKLLASVSVGREDVGQKVASVVLQLTGVDFVKITADAAKTAGLSKGANVLRVPDFAAATLNSDAEALTAAQGAVSSKSAVGAILGGRASELTDDAAKLSLANQALLVKKIAPAVTQIAYSVGQTVDDTAQFAKGFADVNPKVATKIAPGVVLADPENAYDITNTLLDDAALSTYVVKGIAGLAKSIAAVADIEQISLVGSAISDTFHANLTDARGKALTKIASLPAITKTLTKAILMKPSTGTLATGGANKADEIAEVAAYVVGGIVNDAAFTTKAAPKLVLSIIKNAIAGAKTSKKTLPLAPASSYIADVAGSVALTLANGVANADVLAAIKAYITNPKYVKSIAGSANTQTIIDALNLGFSNSVDANTRLENGTLRSDIDLAAIVDPETDTRTF